MSTPARRDGGMSKAEVALLLTFAAAHDQRTIGDADIEAWHLTATDHDWTAAAAQRVAREHYGQGSNRPRLDAPTVTDRIRAIRKKAAETFELPRIPDSLPNADYPKWLRSQLTDHCDQIVQRWAVTGEEPPAQLPPAPPPNRIGQRRLAELTAGAFRDVPAATDVVGNPPTADGVASRRAALAASCPYCAARPGEQCTRSGAGGRVPISHPHPARSGHTSEEAS